jgi:hypothetical protein
MRTTLKKILSDKWVKSISSKLRSYKAMKYRNNLEKLALLYGSDKAGSHHYIKHYETYFKKFKKRKINLLEIGVGGYKHADQGGASLRMWKKYFRNGKIFAIDIYDKTPLNENRINIFKGNQTNRTFLKDVVDSIGQIDLIIDDGSHVNDHIIKSFQFLFPYLKNGGVYVIEDVQTSYWPSFGGNSNNLNDPTTAMNYFKKLTDSINFQELMINNYEPTYFDKHIVGIHFYHNMIFVFKDENNEVSNFLVENRIPNDAKK